MSPIALQSPAILSLHVWHLLIPYIPLEHSLIHVQTLAGLHVAGHEGATRRRQ